MKNYKKSYLLTLAFFCFFYYPSYSQYSIKGKNKDEITKMYITYGDSIANFYVLNEIKSYKIKPQEDRTYSWFRANQVHFTQGAFMGKLLSGDYLLFYRDGNIIEKGNIKKGQKEGKWARWHNNGRIKKKEVWRNGNKHGYSEVFDPAGNLVFKGKYKDGALHGKVYTLKDSVYSKVKFKHGNPQVEKVKIKQTKKKSKITNFNWLKRKES
ncbi:toxin-antitoxin system YwqK family antitoxin [Adhaeribacter soli]|uniref:Toxin-antitoxin system YwqK family antitoxin n=1 Tax=Adhaeribacter soli TaxID=2607655 RepID=A0A5N1IGX8_9BACT|nr:hypothetical protein [Adhaeribacter soli]KAA9324902.1 hypothetical protein F0P94_19445 [Adhaeribacter soli]